MTLKFPIIEKFSGSSIPKGWTAHGSAKMTGDGWMRLVPVSTYQAGTALLSEAFPSNYGIAVEFDLAAHDGTPNEGSVGDGMCFFLVDGTAAASVGGPGGALGYACYHKGRPEQKPGVAKGYVGIALDQWGSFSNKSEAGSDGPGRAPNHLVLRGSGNQYEGYRYLEGKELPTLSLTQQGPTRIHLTILEGKATVGVRQGNTLKKIIANLALDGATGQAELPSSLKLGLSASTGAATNNYDVRNLKISLPLEISQKLRQGPYDLSWPEEFKGAFAYPYRFTLKARKADVKDWRIAFAVPTGTRILPDTGAWYEVVQNGANGIIEIRSPNKSGHTHIVQPGKTLDVDLTVAYKEKKDAFHTASDLHAEQID